MGSYLSRIALAVGLLMGVWGFSSCSQQQGVPLTETPNSDKYSQISISFDATAVVQPLVEASPRALSMELDDRKKKFPTVKGLTDGTKVLCVIRSSNPSQPVNYLQATWKKMVSATKPTYRIVFDGNTSGTPGGGTGFSYDSSRPLGTLSMMLITGGEWDATQKRLVVTPKLVRAEGVSLAYDIPCVSEWHPLQYEFKEGTTPASLQLQLKDYDFDSPTPDHFTLKPVGMLLRMPVEEEMEENGGGYYQLNAITLRSTAFAGRGYFDLSESNIKSMQESVIAKKERKYSWIFTQTAEADERFDVANPAVHFFTAVGATEYGTRRLKRYTPRYYLFLWVMPRDQQPADVTAGNVRTQIYADVDVKVQQAGRNVVYSNDSDADTKGLAGWAIVPQMKALPAYASDRLVRKPDGTNAAFSEGKSYTLTLNLNRPDLPIELISQMPVNSTYTGFATSKEDAAYIDNANGGTVVATLESRFRATNGNAWSLPSFERFAPLLGALDGAGTLSSTATRLDDRVAPYLAPQTYSDAGNYGLNKLDNGQVNIQRVLLALNAKEQGNRVVIYSLLFYPPMLRTTNYNRKGDRLSVLRGEYTTNRSGQRVFRLTMRYIGPYSNDVGVLPADMPEVSSEEQQKALAIAALDKIIAKGDAYWDDRLRKQDDITRDFPMWQKDATTGLISQSGDAGYTWGEMGYMAFHYGKLICVQFGNLGIGYPSIAYGGYDRLNRQAPILMMRNSLVHK